MGVNTYTKFATCPLNIFIHALFSKEGGGIVKKTKVHQKLRLVFMFCSQHKHTL